jgi:hypothetical protein
MSKGKAFFGGFSLLVALALGGCAENSTWLSNTDSHPSSRFSGLLLEVVSSSAPSYNSDYYRGEGSERVSCELYPLQETGREPFFQVKVDRMSNENLGNQFVSVDCRGKHPWVVKRCNASTRISILVSPPSELSYIRLHATLIGSGSGYNYGEYQRYQVFQAEAGGADLILPPPTVELTVACLPNH